MKCIVGLCNIILVLFFALSEAVTWSCWLLWKHRYSPLDTFYYFCLVLCYVFWYIIWNFSVGSEPINMVIKYMELQRKQYNITCQKLGVAFSWKWNILLTDKALGFNLLFLQDWDSLPAPVWFSCSLGSSSRPQ